MCGRWLYLLANSCLLWFVVRCLWLLGCCLWFVVVAACGVFFRCLLAIVRFCCLLLVV